MAEKMIRAYDARAEMIGPVSVLTDPEEKPALTMDGKPMTEEEIASLEAWDKTLVRLLTEDLMEQAMFDGKRIYCSRAHFTASRAAREASEGDAK